VVRHTDSCGFSDRIHFHSKSQLVPFCGSFLPMVIPKSAIPFRNKRCMSSFINTHLPQIKKYIQQWLETIDIQRYIYTYSVLGKLKRPHCDLAGIMVSKRNHLKMALFQVSELLQFVQTYTVSVRVDIQSIFSIHELPKTDNCTGRFPEMWVPPNHPCSQDFFMNPYKQSIWRTPIYGNPYIVPKISNASGTSTWSPFEPCLQARLCSLDRWSGHVDLGLSSEMIWA
jgi:hypothetical protein